MKNWQRIEPTKIQKIGYRKIITKTFKLPDGRIETFDTFYNDGVCVIALTPDNKVLIAQQYRPGPEMVMEELPGGVLEKDEEPDVTIRRELLEETGYESDKWQYLGSVYYSAYNTGEHHYFIAKDCKPSVKGKSHEMNEFITLKKISIAKLLKNAKAGLLTDPGCVLLAYEQLLLLNKPGH